MAYVRYPCFKACLFFKRKKSEGVVTFLTLLGCLLLKEKGQGIMTCDLVLVAFVVVRVHKKIFQVAVTSSTDELTSSVSACSMICSLISITKFCHRILVCSDRYLYISGVI